ncbi:MAG: hypothetical protein GX805_13365 [Gammaproteobacteria bacterium]|nr:hypothetical protein [Gammaproteobacteria bacterium]
MRPALAAASAALLLAACTVAAPAADAGSTAVQQGVPACAGGEAVVFACATGTDRGVAICGSQDGAQLRYIETGEDGGTGPDASRAASADFRSGTLMYSGGGGAYLRFDRDGLEHTVYTGIGRGWEKAGVVVQEDGRTVRELACQGEVTSLIGPELFERASIPADESGFEIP